MTSTSPRVGPGQLVGSLPEQGARAVQPGRVEEDDLARLGGAHAADRRTGGLRTIGDDRHLLTDELVHERRLADVGPADHRDESRAEGRTHGGGAASDSAPDFELARGLGVVSHPRFGAGATSTDMIRWPSMRSTVKS